MNAPAAIAKFKAELCKRMLNIEESALQNVFKTSKPFLIV